MRLAVSYFCVLFIPSALFAEPVSPTQYEFAPKFAVHILEFERSTAGPRPRVCSAKFLDRKTGQSAVFAAVPAGASERCSRVSDYADDALAFVQLSDFEEVENPVENEADIVRINGTRWVPKFWPQVIYRSISVKSDGTHEYGKICQLTLVRESQKSDKLATQKVVFCKPVSPVVAQKRDLEGNLIMENGKPVMFNTMSCPLPAKCLSKEFAIQPVESFSPFQDNTTAHADSDNRNEQAVHKEAEVEKTSTRFVSEPK